MHFNTGNETVWYFWVMALHLENYLGLGKLGQVAVKGPTDTYNEWPLAASGFDSQGRRIVLWAEDTEEIHTGNVPTNST